MTVESGIKFMKSNYGMHGFEAVFGLSPNKMDKPINPPNNNLTEIEWR